MTLTLTVGAARAVARRVARVWTRWSSRHDAWYDARRRPPEGFVAVHVGGVRHAARSVTTFDAAEVAKQTLGRVRAGLEMAGVDHVVLPRPVDGLPLIAVDGDHVELMMRAVRDLAQEREWAVALGSGWRAWQRPLASWSPRVVTPPSRFTLYRALAAPTGQLLGTAAQGVTIEVWPVVHAADRPRVDGDVHVPGTRLAPKPNTSVAYLTPDRWADASGRRPSFRPWAMPHLLDVSFPVDVVYTWVDGADPSWLRRKEEALRGVDPQSVNLTAISASRFAARDELRYSLRSLEMYAGWARTVHIVTCGQVPDWLDMSNPRINVVDHRDIFTDTSVLPVFNSHAIESQLHHIDGLTDHYLYLNDDVFFGRPVAPELFFEANGLSRFFLSAMLLDADPPSTRDLPVLSAAKNNRELIEDVFGRTVTNKFQHTPHPQRRDVLEEMEDRFPDIFKSVARSVVRHPQDVSVAAALHHYYAYATGRAVPGEVRYFYQDIAALTSARDLDRIDEGEGHDVFCLNDTHLHPGPSADRAVELLNDYLERRYPVPSSFEKHR